MQSDKIKNTEEKAEKTEVCEVASEDKMVLSISLDTFYSNKNYAARKI